MPVVVTVPAPPGPISPGANMQWSTDFIGPFVDDNILRVSITADADGLQAMMGCVLQVGQQRSGSIPFLTSRTTQWSVGEHAAPTGSTVFVRLSLESPTQGQVDSGTTQMQWAPESGQALVTQNLAAGAGQGLTTEEATQLARVDASVSVAITVDSTVPISSGIHPPGAFVEAQLPVPVFGLIVRITEIPEGLQAQTPDGVYFVKTLAVVSIFRGSDLWMRVPIHTPTKMVPLFTDVVTAAVATLTAATWIANMSYQVAFGEGVAGEVVEMRFP